MLGLAIGAAVAGIGGALIGGSAQKKAAKTAAASADRTADKQIAFATNQSNLDQANLSPFMQSGQRNNALLDGFLGTAAPQGAAGASRMQYGAPEPMGGGNAFSGAYSGGERPFMGGAGMDRGMASFSPQMQQGYGAPQAMAPQGMAPNPQDAFRNYIANSDYGFQLGEGQNALNHGLASKGMIQSGAAMKDMERFRQNLQAGYRNEYLDRVTGQQNMGLSAASAKAGVGQNLVSNVTNALGNAGAANANAALMRGAATSNMMGGIANSIGNAAGMYAFGSSYGGGGANKYFGMNPASQSSAPW